MEPKSDSRKRAPLGDISNIVPRSKRNLDSKNNSTIADTGDDSTMTNAGNNSKLEDSTMVDAGNDSRLEDSTIAEDCKNSNPEESTLPVNEEEDDPMLDIEVLRWLQLTPNPNVEYKCTVVAKQAPSPASHGGRGGRLLLGIMSHTVKQISDVYQSGDGLERISLVGVVNHKEVRTTKEDFTFTLGDGTNRLYFITGTC